MGCFCSLGRIKVSPAGGVDLTFDSAKDGWPVYHTFPLRDKQCPVPAVSVLQAPSSL